MGDDGSNREALLALSGSGLSVRRNSGRFSDNFGSHDMFNTYPGQPPTPAAGTAPDPVALALILSLVFVPPMYLFFRLGLQQLVTWFETRARY
jgi:hypothetical protein